MTLGKGARLCDQRVIDRLFGARISHASSSSDQGVLEKDATSVESALAYPLRAVWTTRPLCMHGERVKVLFSMPKKRLHHAVDRVLMRRRTREAYRLLRGEYFGKEIGDDCPGVEAAGDNPGPELNILLVYVAPEVLPYERVRRAVERLLQKIAQQQECQP